MKRILIALSLSLAAISAAHAQTSNCRVSTSSPTYSNGATAPLSCDTSGALRTSGGGGGGSDVNIAGVNGNPSSATNPLYVAPVTASNPWPVSGTVAISGTVAATQSGSWNVDLNAGSNIIGNVRIDQTTPGTTNGVQDAATGSTGSAVPSKAQLAGVQSGANLVSLLQASASVAITMSTATTTQFVALSGSTKIYVTSFDVIAGGTTNVTLVYGTGTNCGTGTTALTGAYPLTAQAGIAKGNGLGPVLVVPAGNALCVTNSAAQQISGSVSYTQF